MVYLQLPGLTNSPTGKSIQSHLLFALIPPDVVQLDQVELDFSDVFGPLPVQAPIEENCGDFVNLACADDVSQLIYDDPVVVCNRSHSLVGPSTLVSQSMKLSKLTLHDIHDSVEVDECVHLETIKKLPESSVDNGTVEKPLELLDGDVMKFQSVGIEDFESLKVVGEGAFAKVYQVRKRGTSEIYAMKVMRKDKIMKKHLAEYTKLERDILTKIDHPFIVQLRYAFQTKYRLYLVLDFVNGGHLFFQIYKQGLFREDLARVYFAEIVSAVSHLHANGIMHRDLKPENILLNADGHVILIDFGLAKQFHENTRSDSICGTVDYMSPEVILGKDYDKTTDWWSAGILLFEMLTGKLPFTGSREKVQQKIVKEKIKLPPYLTSEAHSLLKGLLQKDASKRLGSGPRGSEEIKQHKWFKPINWKKLEALEIQPSFRPQVAGKHCIANFETKLTSMPVLYSPVCSPKMNENVFTGFNYVRPAPCSAFPSEE